MKNDNPEKLTIDDFTQEEKDRIQKRIDNEFLLEYIEYINNRNKLNTKPKNKNELKEKVISYIIGNLPTKEDCKTIAENTTHIDTKNDNFVGAGAENTIYKIEKSKLIQNTKKTNHYIVYGDTGRAREGTFNKEAIALKGLLSLVERQTKYYSQNHMKKVNCISEYDKNTAFKIKYGLSRTKQGDDNIIIEPAITKTVARMFFIPIQDEKPDNCFYETQSHHPLNINEHCFDSYIGGINDTYGISNPALFLIELKKMLAITPQLLHGTTYQHLKNINVDSDENIEKQTLQFFLTKVQTLQMFCDMFDKLKDGTYKNNPEYFKKYFDSKFEIFSGYNKSNDENLTTYIKTNMRNFENFYKKNKNRYVKF